MTQQPVQDARGGTFFSRGRVVAASAVAACVLAAGGAAAAGGATAAPTPSNQTTTADGPTGASQTGASQTGASPASQESPASAVAAPRLRVGLRSAATWRGTAGYALAMRDGTKADVTVVRDGTRLRLDVRSGAATSTLIGNEQGWTACQSESGASCVLVAGPGAALPAAFDPGIGALVTITLPALADRKTGMIEAGWLASGKVATEAVAAAACVEVIGQSSPQFCVTEQGLLRRARFIAGTLTLTSVSASVDAAAFTAPAPAVPLA